MDDDIVIVAAGRSAVGNFGGSLATIPAPTLGAKVIKGLIDQTKIDPASVGEVIMGNVLTAGLGQNAARQALIEAGLPVWAAGILVSGVSGLLLFSPLVRRLAERYSTRKVMILALTTAGFSMFALATIGTPAPLGILFWCIAALGCICLDVLGNIPFMRMVKSYERTDMTMVFSTWREMSELVTPLSITLITLFFPFSAFYLAFGCVFLVVSITATLLPKRL